MKKVMLLLVIAMLVLTACNLSLDESAEDEGSFTVIEDEDAGSEDVFAEIDNLDQDTGDLVVDEEEVEDESDLEVVDDEEFVEEDSEELVIDEPVEDEADDQPTTIVTETGDLRVTVNEGELVRVRLDAKDPDGDELTFKYEKPLNEKGEWQTSLGDDGKYYTTVTVSDGETAVEVEVLIEVLSVNEDPVLEPMKDLTVNEGETIRLSPKAIDPDGDKIFFEYSGWMTSDTKNTDYDDAGTHEVIITVSDGNGGEDSQTLTVTVKDVNRAPVISGLN
ncbi:hypothetical protein KY330_03595 [Candidatus Woesearchaeota archaeon]|nr:hypothetical protein [Candidatus Woesearchaeota archaeon]